MELLAGLALVGVGVALLTHDHAGFGMFNLAFGLFFAWRGARRHRSQASINQNLQSAEQHADEIGTRAERGEGPDQIAEAFDTQYGITPVQTLEYLGLNRLRIMGQGQDEQLTQANLAWLTAHRPEPLPTADDVVAHLDPRKNLFASSRDILSHLGHKGGLVATRTHLLFLPLTHEESFSAEAAKETFIDSLPEIVGLATLATTMVKGVGAELMAWNDPKLIAEYRHRLAAPGGLAIPWRELVGVRKDAVKGTGVDRVHLVIGWGDPEAPTELRFSKDSGLSEVWVDDWIDVVRMAVVLEGRLLYI